VTVEALRTGSTSEVEATVRVKGSPTADTLCVHRVVAAVGFRPDTSLYSELHVHTCWATDGPIKLAASLLAAGGGGGDCLAQVCGPRPTCPLSRCAPNVLTHCSLLPMC
jgi:hypothetical protein